MAGSSWTNQVQSLVIVQSGGNFQGLFVYSPTPGAGNLSSSVATVTGTATDPYTNVYLDGIVNYATSGGPPIFAVQLSGGAVLYSTATSEAGPWTSVSSLSGLSSGGQGAVEVSPAFAFVTQSSGVTAISGSPLLWSDTNGNLEVTLPSGQGAPISTGLGDVSVNTVTGTGANALTKIWPIKAADMKVSTKYRIQASGWGKQGSTQQALTVGVGFGSTQKRTAGFATSILGISANFEWKADYTMTCLTTGVTGTVWLACLFAITTIGIQYTLTNFGPVVSFGSNTSSAGETLNTTAATDMELFAGWGATVGAPSISCVESSFERIAT